MLLCDPAILFLVSTQKNETQEIALNSELAHSLQHFQPHTWTHVHEHKSSLTVPWNSTLTIKKKSGHWGLLW